MALTDKLCRRGARGRSGAFPQSSVVVAQQSSKGKRPGGTMNDDQRRWSEGKMDPGLRSRVGSDVVGQAVASTNTAKPMVLTDQYGGPK